MALDGTIISFRKGVDRCLNPMLSYASTLHSSVTFLVLFCILLAEKGPAEGSIRAEKNWHSPSLPPRVVGRIRVGKVLRMRNVERQKDREDVEER